MVIMGYPYASTLNLGVFDHNGNEIPFEVRESRAPKDPPDYGF